MTFCTTPGITLRKINIGEDDLIVTVFTQHHGKVSLIAKHAKKSIRRFAGVLELFCSIHIVWNNGKSNLPVLQEAYLKHPYENIRGNILKTAYASYWSEIIMEWVEEKTNQPEIYHLFDQVLMQLNVGKISDDCLNILFQIRFLDINGLKPNLSACSICKTHFDNIPQPRMIFDIQQCGIICPNCDHVNSDHLSISKGTIKYLQWLIDCDMIQVAQLRFSTQSTLECTHLMESLISYHLGKCPKSLLFLKQIRKTTIE